MLKSSYLVVLKSCKKDPRYRQ